MGNNTLKGIMGENLVASQRQIIESSLRLEVLPDFAFVYFYLSGS